jgi:Bacterial Ig domain
MKLRFPLLALLLVVISWNQSTAAPVANPDTYSLSEDTPLNIITPGLLGNDTTDGAAITAAKVTDPVHGSVIVNSNGSFLYTPAANFSGADSFTYKAVEAQRPVTFTVDQPNSVMTVRADSRTFITGGTTDSKTTTAQVYGTVGALVTPSSAPFSTVQVQSMDVALAQPVSLTLCVQRLLICTATVTAQIARDGLRITMAPNQAGPAVSVSSLGAYTQTGNFIDTTGTMTLTGSGLAGLITIPPTADINSLNQPYDFNNGSITQSAGTLTLSVPIDITQSFAESGDLANPGAYLITVRVTGTVRATAPVPTVVESSPTTVSLQINPVNDVPVGANDRYYSRQNHTISIPATAAQTTETLVPALSAWKYRTGTDLGTAWRDPEYDDTAWLSVSDLKGYGDPDIPPAGTVLSRPNPADAANTTTNQNYPTCYFRKEVTLANPYDTIQPKITVQRDDAAMVWVNGVEVYRDSTKYLATDANAALPASGEVPYSAYAMATIQNETEYKEITFSRSVLREGKNVIAVAVKQASNISSDLRFDATFSRTRGVQGVLTNDTDMENDTLTAELVSLPLSDGSAVVSPNGSFTYTPGLGFVGTDSFLYRLRQNGALVTTTSEVIAMGATWKYLDPTVDQAGNGWQMPTFAESGWLTGPSPLGFGTSGNYPEIATAGTPLTWGDTASAKPITHYFRRKFTLPTAKAFVSALKAQIRRDDGIALWLNGVEVARDNLPGTVGDGTITHTTTASAALNALPADFIEKFLPITNLVDGENTLAIEVHQAAPSSSDLVMDLRLLLDFAPGAKVEVVVLGDDADNDNVSDTWERAHGFDSAIDEANGDADGDGQSNRNEFLAGTNPRSEGDVLRARQFTQNGNTLSLTIPTVAGKSYQLQCSTDLQNWSTHGASFSPGANSAHNHTFNPASGCGFYRVRVLQEWE